MVKLQDEYESYIFIADILAYDVDLVSVGIDQKQHVELARDIAIRFNNKYGETFKVPEPLISRVGTKILDLADPYHKMSKSSSNEKGVIRMLDDLDAIRKKIMGAVTDSDLTVKFDMESKPGISNLINIYSSVTGDSIEEVENKFADSNYGEFKRAVAEVVTSEIGKIQEKYYKILDSDELDTILDNGISVTRKIAKAKYELMKDKIGLGR